MIRSLTFKILRVLTIGLLLPLIATSCLDIEEQIKLNRNGSGTYEMTIDMSEAMGMLQMMGGGQSGESDQITQSVDSAMEVTIEALRKIEGISNIETKAEDFVMTVKYDFADVEALNKANSQSDAQSPMGASLPTSNLTKGRFEWSKKTFARLNPELGDLMNGNGDPQMEEAMSMMRMMMGEATYTSSYIMPGKVKSVSNEDATIQDDKKTVQLQIKLVDFMDQKAFLGNSIRFKRR